jgi:hypothetical protein
MAIDLGGNGRFDSDESFPLSDLVQFYGQYYRLDLTDDLKGLTFTPVRPQLGAVAIKAGDPACEIRTGKAVLWSDVACGSFGLSRGVWELPAGHYLLRTGDMEVRDAEGNVWLLRTRVQEGQGCQFDVSVGQTTELRLGPPLSAGIEIQRVLPLRISPTLAGSGGELYHPAGILRNRGTSRQPVFKIVDEQGTVLYTGADQSTWRVPGDFRGRIRVEVKWDVAPPAPQHRVALAFHRVRRRGSCPAGPLSDVQAG